MPLNADIGRFADPSLKMALLRKAPVPVKNRFSAWSHRRCRRLPAIYDRVVRLEKLPEGD
jgi:hypothetical protein